MKIYDRSEWTSILPRFAGVKIPDEIDGLPNFQENEVKGIAIHFVGSRGDLGNRDPRGLWEQFRQDDMVRKNWSDIQYNLGVAQELAGVWTLRGLINKGAANGSGNNGKTARVNNSEYISIVCAVGATELPTDLLFENLKDARKLVLAKYPTATDIRPHFYFSKTDCPGENIGNVIFTSNGEIDKAFWEGTPVGEKVPSSGYVPPTIKGFKCELPPPVLRLDDRNMNVYSLQNYLAFFGYYRVRVDGHYGPITRAAVMQIQDELRRLDLYPFVVDGVYGPKTKEGWCELLASLHVIANS